MNVYRLVVTVIDFDGLGADEIKRTIECTRYANNCISPEVRYSEVRDIGEWTDSHPLNMRNQSEAEYKRLFNY
jgi:hypothetical protein